MLCCLVKKARTDNIATGKHFLSSARLIAGLTLASRILGFTRDAVCMGYFTTAVWHYFVTHKVDHVIHRQVGGRARSQGLGEKPRK